ncbi:MAG: PEP/pyruvate-binding domain-containing protein, partial [Candidatus Caldatribacteriota bacterium]|nr:PEP/pyruvate-binding domain-containing protein [Candidatus Caldatribacteriota bacterium]
SFIEYNKINVKIEKLLKNLDNNDFESIKKISSKIKNLFEQTEIPEDLLAEIDHLYEQIGSPEVVVRSSATLEDSPVTSFAGQYDSFLNVKGKEQLHKYVKLCWASLWNARALSYRLKQNMDDNELAHGVIIQKLIKAEKSGILFTVNPVNGRRDQMLINSSWGLGEAIVSGDVTPDQWIVDKKNHKILEEKITVKEIMSVRKDNGTELVDVPGEKCEESSLDQSEVHKLLELGQNVEDYFGLPQDIEWVYCDNKFYLVQSRPITTLFPKLEPEDSGEELRVYMNFLLNNQVIPEPLTPIGEDMWKKALKYILLNRKNRDKPTPWIKSATGRLFIDATELSRLERWWDKIGNNPSDMDPLTTKALLEVLERNKAELKKQRKPLIKLIMGILIKMNPLFLKFLLTSIPKALYGILFSPEKVVAKAYKFGKSQIISLEQKVEKLHTREEKIEFIEQKMPSFFYFIPLQIIYYVARSFTYIDKARTIISKHLDDTSELSKVEKSLPHNVTTEMGMELLRIAQKFDQSGEPLVSEHPEIKKFLNRYGHRACLEVDLGVPRWKEDPEYVISLIQSYISNKTYNEGIKKFYQGKKEAEKTIQNITKQLKEKGAHRDARKVEKILKKYRKLFGVRELPKYIMTKAVSICREILLEIGEELVTEERLDDKQDIFFISFQDIKSGEKLQQLVLQNREKYQKELKRSSVPRVVTSTGETIFSASESEKDNEYEGIPVSPGIYEGQVKVLEHPEDGNKLKKGDILVTKATNPAWTPLFLEIGGLITEMGGPISHGSVIAREYGIPAIVGIREATSRFKDGQFIRLNGETGKVEILNPSQ